MTQPNRATSLVNRVAAAAAVLVVIGFWAVLEYRRRTADIPPPSWAMHPSELPLYFPPDPDASETQPCTPPVTVPRIAEPSR